MGSLVATGVLVWQAISVVEVHSGACSAVGFVRGLVVAGDLIEGRGGSWGQKGSIQKGRSWQVAGLAGLRMDSNGVGCRSKSSELVSQGAIWFRTAERVGIAELVPTLVLGTR